MNGRKKGNAEIISCHFKQNCNKCIYIHPILGVENLFLCRRYPQPQEMEYSPLEHWCGEYKDQTEWKREQ